MEIVSTPTMSSSSNDSFFLMMKSEREAFQKYQLVPLSIIVIVGFVANMMVVHAGLKKSCQLKYTTNSFILNLAVADLGMVLIFIPTLIVEYTYGMRVPDWICKYFVPIRETFSIMSINTVAGLGMVRFLQIHKAHVLLSVRLTYLVIAAIWFFAYFTISLPQSFVIALTVQHTCDFFWQSRELKKIHIAYVIFILILPLLVTTLCNLCITGKVRPRNRELSDSKKSELEQKSQKIRILLFMLILTAWLSVGPLLIFITMMVYTDYFSDFPTLVWNFVCVFFTSSSAINPVLVLIMNKDYRHEIRRSFYRRERIVPQEQVNVEMTTEKAGLNTRGSDVETAFS